MKDTCQPFAIFTWILLVIIFENRKLRWPWHFYLIWLHLFWPTSYILRSRHKRALALTFAHIYIVCNLQKEHWPFYAHIKGASETLTMVYIKTMMEIYQTTTTTKYQRKNCLREFGFMLLLPKNENTKKRLKGGKKE